MSQSTEVLPVRPVTLESPSLARSNRESGFRLGPYVCLGVALLTFLFANGRWIVPVAALIAPIFMVRFVRTQRPLWGLGLLFVGLAAVGYVSWWGMVPAPGILYFVIVTAITAGQLAPLVVDRLLSPRFEGLARTLVLPCAVASGEFLSFAVSPYGTWGAWGYTQFANLPLLQLASVTGLCGIGFLMSWFAAVVNDAWEKSFVWRRFRVTACSFAAVSALVLISGAVRLALFPPTAETVRVASITAPDAFRESVNLGELAKSLNVSLTPSIPDVVWQALIRKTQSLNAYLAAQSRREAQAGAKIVFWPEGQAVATRESEAELIELGRRTARSEKIYLGMGMAVLHREDQDIKVQNRFLFLDPDGNALLDYTKQNPVPGGEARRALIPVHDYHLPTVDTPHGRIAGAICFDMDFPRFIRQAGEARADMILAPSNDWQAIDPLHTQMAAVRGIELGCAVIRHTSNGLSQAADCQGHVLARMDHFATPSNERVMVAHVPIRGTPTLYARFGDLFGWGCVLGLAALVGIGVTHRPRELSAV
jgi:apolipoprotein N-acyltransferase